MFILDPPMGGCHTGQPTLTAGVSELPLLAGAVSEHMVMGAPVLGFILLTYFSSGRGSESQTCCSWGAQEEARSPVYEPVMGEGGDKQ